MSVQSQSQERGEENDGDAEMGSLSPHKSEKPQMGASPVQCGTADSMEGGAVGAARQITSHD